MREMTVSERRKQREDEIAEPFNRAERFAASTAAYINENRLVAAKADQIGNVVEIVNRDRKCVVTALPGGKWNLNGSEIDHVQMLDAVLKFFGWPQE